MSTTCSYCLIIFGLITRLCSIRAQHSSLITIGGKFHVWKAVGSININMEDVETKLLAYSYVDHDQRTEDTEVTTNLRSWRGQNTSHHRHLKIVRLTDEILYVISFLLIFEHII